MFEKIRPAKSNRFPKTGRARQNLSGLIVLFLLVGLAGQALAFSKRKQPEKFEFDRQIRVWLGTQDSVALNSSGEMVIECYRNGVRGEIYYTPSIISGTASKTGITIQDDNGILAIDLTSIVFKPRFPNVFLDYNDKRYRGFIECDMDKSDGRIRVFNLIDIESYLKGVLPGEIGERTDDEFEAAKAQAIAARTYAIWRLSTQLHDDKHLKNSIDDQLYLGAGAELPLLSKAVDETAGTIMTRDNLPIAAYYHAVCGGSTAPIEKVWDSEKISYLSGTVDGDYCQWARTFFWNENFDLDRLKANLTEYFSQKGVLPRKGLGQVLSVKFEKDHSIGRMTEMKIKTSTGEFSVQSDQIRWALKRASNSGGILPSTRFNSRLIKSQGAISGLELVGAGNGHGVGMCQCGAIGRARAGYSCEEILNTYYFDIVIQRIY